MSKYLEYLDIHFGNPIEVAEPNLMKIIGKEAIAITGMYNFLLTRKVVSKGTRKLNIFLTEDKTKDYKLFVDKVGYIYKTIDPSSILDITAKQDRYEYVNKQILGAISNYGKTIGWEQNILKEAHDIILERGTFFKEYFGKKITHKKTARLFFNFSEQYIEVYLEINDEHNILLTKIKTSSTFFETLKTYFLKMEWIDDDTVKILHSNEEDYWLISVSKNESSFCLDKAVRGDAKAQYDLGMIYLKGLNVLEDKKKAIMWLTKSADKGYGKAKKQMEEMKPDA